jgi:8-oxo-dGTP diphosphatase
LRHIVNGLLMRDGRVLMARRAQNRKAYPGRWSFPGGHVETGETLDDALIRECREEIKISPTKFRFVISIPDPNVPDSDPAVYHMYAVKEWVGGEPESIGDEHTALEWFAFDIAAALPDLALEEYRPLLRELDRA